MDGLTILGLTGGVCTSAAYLPQVLKIWKTKQARDISLGMYLVMNFGMLLWLIYGILRRDIPLIASNLISLTFGGTILYLKLRDGNKSSGKPV